MPQTSRPAYTARAGEAVQVFRNEDGSFAIGVGRIRIAAPDNGDMAFVALVVDDLGRLAHSPAGEEALRRGDAVGQTVLIEKPVPPTAPANAWTLPVDLAAAALPGISITSRNGGAAQGVGTGCGSTIVYDPADWPQKGDPDSPGRGDILLTMIEQANANAAGKSNPLLPDWGVRLRR